jgi:hypothetical protein
MIRVLRTYACSLCSMPSSLLLPLLLPSSAAGGGDAAAMASSASEQHPHPTINPFLLRKGNDTHPLVGLLVAALIRGDGAADLGQHIITMLQGVAGGVAV